MNTNSSFKKKIFFLLTILVCIALINASKIDLSQNSSVSQADSPPDSIKSSIFVLLGTIGSFISSIISVLYCISGLYGEGGWVSLPSIGISSLFALMGLYGLITSEFPRTWKEFKIMSGIQKPTVAQQKISLEQDMNDKFLESVYKVQNEEMGGKKKSAPLNLKWVISMVRLILAILMLTMIFISVLRTFCYFSGTALAFLNYNNRFNFNGMFWEGNDTTAEAVAPLGFSYLGILRFLSLILRGKYLIMTLGVISSFNELFMSYYKISKVHKSLQLGKLQHENRVMISRIIIKSLLYLILMQFHLPLIIMLVDPIFKALQEYAIGEKLINLINPPLGSQYYTRSTKITTMAEEKKKQTIYMIIGAIAYTIIVSYIGYQIASEMPSFQFWTHKSVLSADEGKAFALASNH